MGSAPGFPKGSAGAGQPAQALDGWRGIAEWEIFAALLRAALTTAAARQDTAAKSPAAQGLFKKVLSLGGPSTQGMPVGGVHVFLNNPWPTMGRGAAFPGFFKKPGIENGKSCFRARFYFLQRAGELFCQLKTPLHNRCRSENFWSAASIGHGHRAAFAASLPDRRDSKFEKR